MIYFTDLPIDILYYIFNCKINIGLLFLSSKYLKNIINIFCYENINDYTFYEQGMSYFKYFTLVNNINNYDSNNNFDVSCYRSYFLLKNKIYYKGQHIVSESNSLIPKVMNIKHKVMSISVGYSNISAITDNRDLYFCQDYNFIKKNIPNNKKVLTVNNGYDHVLILDLNKNVYSFGMNETMQLGLGDHEYRDNPTLIDTVKNIKFKIISAGRNHSMIVSEKNQLFSFGWGRWGFLGRDFTNNDEGIPKKVNIDDVVNVVAGDNFSVIVDNNGIAYGCGLNNYNELTSYMKVINIPIIIYLPFKVKNVSLGIDHVLFISEENEIYSKGNNWDGRLGLGDNNNREIATKLNFNKNIKNIKSKYFHSIINVNDDTYYGFGNNFWNQIASEENHGVFSPQLIKLKN